MHIKIAGLLLNWTKNYAQIYCSKLIEMGFTAKVLPYKGNCYIVAYSHDYFTCKDINLDSIEGNAWDKEKP